MQWNSKKTLGALVILIVIAAASFGIWHYEKTKVPAFPIDSADTISSWNFKGAYTGNDTLVTQANNDITHLKSLMGKGQYDDYDLYIGIANDDNLLGDGKGAYDNYDHAVKIHPTKGLAYANLGHLFDELGAYNTAADAYAKATAVEPAVLEYHLERLQFLVTRFPKDNAKIIAALQDVGKQFGDVAQVLVIEGQWLEGQGRISDAIKAFQTAIMISPSDRQAPIQAEINRLKAKQ